MAGGFGSRFAGQAAPAQTPGGFGSRTAAPAARHDNGGFLGALAHVLGQTGSDFYHAAIDSPAGLYHLGSGLIHDPLGTVEQVGKGVIQDFQHPLRHPGYTLLDVLGALDGGASVVGRVGAAGRALETGARAGDVAKALLHKPVPAPRNLALGEATVQAPSAAGVLARGVQKGTDKLLANTHASSPDSLLGKAYLSRVGKHLTANESVLQAAAQGPAAALQAIGKGLRPEEQMALRAVAEQTPIAGRLAAHADRIAANVPALEQLRHQDRIGLLNGADKLLTADAHGKPAFLPGPAADKLQPIYDRMAKVAGDRQALLKHLDMLGEEAMQARANKAGRASLGQPLTHPEGPKPDIPGQLSLINEPKQQLFEAGKDALYVPDVRESSKLRNLLRAPRLGAQGSIGHQQKLGSLKENQGILRKTAGESNDTTQLVAQASQALAKFQTGERLRAFAQEAGHMIPNSVHDVFVRGGNLAAHDKLPGAVRDFIANPEQTFKASPTEGASRFGEYLNHVFVPVRDLSPEQIAEYERLAHEGAGTFMNKRALGDYAKTQAPLAAVTGKLPVGVLDAINNASRAAIFYGKPAYAAPNVLGNAALNLIQQGFAAVPNLAKSVRMNALLGPEATARIDTLMGEGFAQSIAGHEGAMTKGVQAAANFWSKGVDRPFRRASFLYEAKRAGYDSPTKLTALLAEPAHAQELVGVTRRANRAIIDYASMSPIEREIIRRIVFVYPWLRGSTAYAAHFASDHPVQAAATGQLGKQGQQQEASLGPVPSYLQGSFKAGGGLVNPTSAAILQTPAQIAGAAAGLATGDVNKASELSGFLSPAAAALLAEVTRRSSQGYGYKQGTNALDIAKDSLTSSLPQVLLYQRIRDTLEHKPQDAKLYPASVKSALLSYLVGGLAPRPYSQTKLNALAAREKTQMRTGR